MLDDLRRPRRQGKHLAAAHHPPAAQRRGTARADRGRSHHDPVGDRPPPSGHRRPRLSGPPHAHPQHLSGSWPIQVSVQGGGRPHVAPLPAVPGLIPADRAGAGLLGRRGGEQRAQRPRHLWLVPLNRHHIVPVLRPNLAAQRVLAGQRIAAHEASGQGQRGQERGRHRPLPRPRAAALTRPAPPIAPAPGRPRPRTPPPTAPRATPRRGCPAAPCRRWRSPPRRRDWPAPTG